MSNAVSALNEARFDGLGVVQEQGLCGMITLRGDLASKPLRAAVKAAVGVDVPAQRQVTLQDGSGAAWMSPDELLLMCPHGDAAAVVEQIGAALAGEHHMVVNVSDARALFAVNGPHAREVLAKLSPADLSPDAFQPGEIRRTRMAQVAAAFWMEEDGSLRVICFRSVAEYVFGLLKAGAQPGSAVGVY